MKAISFKKLPTEQANPHSLKLDSLPVEKIVDLMVREDQKISRAIYKARNEIANAARLIAQSLRNQGKILFVGAGTSGRLGVLEAAELPPTFSIPARRAQALMAGGKSAVFRSKEGAEDDAFQAKLEVEKRARPGDVLVGIAASGVTPFVRAALDQARKMRVATIFVTCNFQTSKKVADAVIAVNTGPEILAGSTRLKAGTATKMVLNMMTTAAMVRTGKVYGNKMVDLQAKSRKLQERAVGLVEELTGLSRKKSQKALNAAGGNVKSAILMVKQHQSLRQARKLLDRHQGSLRAALNNL